MRESRQLPLLMVEWGMANLKQKIGQTTIIGISGKTLTDEEKSFIIENNIGGVILFARNIESPQQLLKLNMEIQSLRHKMVEKAPLFIAIDMEEKSHG